MAEAKGHKFGQTLGEWCEAAIEPLLRRFAESHDLYLDRQGPRPARTGRKVRWIDSYGNSHDLDFVLERGGSDDRVGTPVAFIESAWRRYTKHSRNKAQEIQGAVAPLRDRYDFSAPLVGCFLVGEYTPGSLAQLRSLGFQVLHFPYPTVIAALESVGIDATFDERTTDRQFAIKQKQWSRLTSDQRALAGNSLVEANRENVEGFFLALERTVRRQIATVTIVPLHGSAHECLDVAEAIRFVETYREGHARQPILKYEVTIRYDSGDRIDATFHEKDAAIAFLDRYQSGHWTPKDPAS